MKKYLWMMAAFLTGGVLTTTITSCGDDESASAGGGEESPVVEATLLGDWLTVMETCDEESPEIRYSLLSFGKDRVVTMRTYQIHPEEPENYSERMRRHVIYSVDEVAGTISLNYDSGTETDYYVLTRDTLFLSNGDGDQVFAMYRPSKADLDLLRDYDQTIWSNDYVGKWFCVNEKNGLYTYMMLDINENGKVNTKRYSVYGEDCQRTATSRFYGDYDTVKYSGKVLEIHNETDYQKTTHAWWLIKDEHLYLGDMLQDINNFAAYHPLTPADLEKMAELDEMVKE